jgi:CTP:molybdopterin cytidylyltransferase MocA
MTAQRATVVPVILAAGASSRMGRPKALLELGGTTVLSRAIAACRHGGADGPVVVVAEGAAAIEAHARELGADVAVNPHPERGQLSSLQAGLARLPQGADAFLLFPVDYALVEADDVRRLLAAFAARPAGGRILTPTFAGRRGHPVVIDAALAPAFLALGEGATARDVIGAHERVPVEMAADRVLHDMDTPADYERMRARLSG